MGLHPIAITVYCYLASCSEDFHPSNRMICDKLNITYNTLTKYLNELKNQKIIAVHIQGNNTRATQYKFTQQSEWI